MKKLTTLALAAALLAGVPAIASAQETGNPATNAAASGGPGTHQGAVKTGTASSNQKVFKNQNGYRGQQ